MDIDDGEEVKQQPKPVPRTAGGKIINRLEEGEEQDDNQVEQIPDPFGAEQTYISDAEL